MKTYVVYRHTAPNGKMYVGITSMVPEKRWSNGFGYVKSPLFFRAINKYGWENFKHEILLEGLTIEQASLAERIFIGYWNLTNSDCGYNLEGGGLQHYDISDATRKKMSESASKRRASEETRRKMSIANTGRRHTDEAKRKIAKHHSGVGNPMYGKYGKDNPTSKRVSMIDSSGNVVLTFDSIREAAAHVGIEPSGVCWCCKGKQKTAGGCRWKYDDNLDDNLIVTT